MNSKQYSGSKRKNQCRNRDCLILDKHHLNKMLRESHSYHKNGSKNMIIRCEKREISNFMNDSVK